MDKIIFHNGDLSLKIFEEYEANILSNYLSNPEFLKYYKGRDNINRGYKNK